MLAGIAITAGDAGWCSCSGRCQDDVTDVIVVQSRQSLHVNAQTITDRRVETNHPDRIATDPTSGVSLISGLLPFQGKQASKR